MDTATAPGSFTATGTAREPWGLGRLVRRLLPAGTPCAVRWNGRTVRLGDGPPAFTLVVRSPWTLVPLVLRPSMLGLGEAYVDGAIDLEGDLPRAVEAAFALAGDDAGGAAARARARTSADPEAVARHYEVSNDFYALFLDRRMLYTCAYYRTPDATLDEAQEAKLDLVCRKLRLAPGETLLDVGCGWGALVAWAAERHGVRAHGVTLSAAQASRATALLARAGLADRARIERCDWRALPDTLVADKIAAVGIIEHVGVASYPEWFARVRGWLRPGGLFLSHGITHPTTSPRTSAMAFLDRHVFPGGDLASVEHTTTEMERAGFEIIHVEALGPHYVRTAGEWVARLTARRAEAVALVGERAYRIWAGYLAAATVAFREGWIDVHQVLARRR